MSADGHASRLRLSEAARGVTWLLDAHPEVPDGFVLEGQIIYPNGFDEKKKYPVWVQTYAGPHAPTVRDGWGGRTADGALSNAGIIIFKVDPRSASGNEAIGRATRNGSGRDRRVCLIRVQDARKLSQRETRYVRAQHALAVVRIAIEIREGTRHTKLVCLHSSV